MEVLSKLYPKTSRILGIDLSINSTGVCLLEGESTYYYNIISDSKYGKGALQKYMELAKQTDCLDLMLYQRCPLKDDYNVKEHSNQQDIEKILNCIVSIIDCVEPTTVVLEGLSFGSRNTNSLTTLSGLHHLVRYESDLSGIEWKVITPSELKKFATGKGNADKELMVQSWHVCDPKMNIIPVDDLADAYFLARYGASIRKL